LDGGGDAESAGGKEVGDDEGVSSSELVDEEDAADFSDNGEDGVGGLKEEGHLGFESDGFEDGGRVVLDDGDTGHLGRELENDTESDLSHVLRVGEDLLESVLGEEGLLLDLMDDFGELGLDEDVLLVSGSMKTGKGTKSFLVTADHSVPSLISSKVGGGQKQVA
jgi:hypothetical protein